MTDETSTDGSIPHVPADEVDRIFKFLRDLMPMLGTPRYVIEIEPEPADDDCYASIRPNPQRYRARVRLCREWMELPAEKRRLVIIHEACHLLHHKLDHLVDDGSLNLMHEHEHEPFVSAYKREIEFIVDQLSVTLADHAAPDWPDS